MRKFTKEITALMASAALGAAGIGAITASSEEAVPTAGVPMLTDETISPTEAELVELEGELMPPDDDLPEVDGGIMVPDELVETAGVVMIPDETTEPTEELPPLMGDIAPADGDVNGDGLFNIADVVAFERWLLNSSDVEMFYWWTADFYSDGKLDSFDLALMKKALIGEK
ncbi:MAG: dockerin type I repeat-containing protein [Alistipes sp.]|nr:dockerin type I repeat-containing protein [Alistipes sp.]